MGCLLQVRGNFVAPGSSPGFGGLGGLLSGLFGRRLQLFGPSQQEEDVWMMGGVFLEHFVTIFDFDNARLGFAQRAATAQAPSNPFFHPFGLVEVRGASTSGAVDDLALGVDRSPDVSHLWSVAAASAISSAVMGAAAVAFRRARAS